MNTEKVGKLISRLRKEKELTQKELADILGVSPKTVSKWECGSGLPDISIIKKISEEFDITLEELLDGTKKETKNKKRYILVSVPIILVIIVLLLSIILLKKNNDTTVYCTVIRTYMIENISNSNDENYTYVTISEFQTEGIFTIKIPKIESEKLKEKESYEFTFKTNEKDIGDTTDNLFNNSEIIKIEHSNKVGLDRTNTYYCS